MPTFTVWDKQIGIPFLEEITAAFVPTPPSERTLPFIRLWALIENAIRWSDDDGETWTSLMPLEKFPVRSGLDPTLFKDSRGHFYYNSQEGPPEGPRIGGLYRLRSPYDGEVECVVRFRLRGENWKEHGATDAAFTPYVTPWAITEDQGGRVRWDAFQPDAIYVTAGDNNKLFAVSSNQLRDFRIFDVAGQQRVTGYTSIAFTESEIICGNDQGANASPTDFLSVFHRSMNWSDPIRPLIIPLPGVIGGSSLVSLPVAKTKFGYSHRQPRVLLTPITWRQEYKLSCSMALLYCDGKLRGSQTSGWRLRSLAIPTR